MRGGEVSPESSVRTDNGVEWHVARVSIGEVKSE